LIQTASASVSNKAKKQPGKKDEEKKENSF